MSEEERPKKIYLGNLQEKTRKRSGDKFLTGNLCLDEIENVPPELIYKGKNGKRYVKVLVNPFIYGANGYGYTHSVAVDKYDDAQNNDKKNDSVNDEKMV